MRHIPFKKQYNGLFHLYAHHPHIRAKHDVGISNTLISFWSLLNPESEKLFAVLRITRWLPSTHFAFFLSFFFFYWCRAASIKHFNTSASLLLYTSFTGQFSGFIKAKLKSIFFFILKLIICAIRRQFREMLIPL